MPAAPFLCRLASPHHARRPGEVLKAVDHRISESQGAGPVEACSSWAEIFCGSRERNGRAQVLEQAPRPSALAQRPIHAKPPQPHQYRRPHEPAFCARRDSTRPGPHAGARRNYHRTRGRGGARRCGSLQPGTGPPRGAGQPAGRSLSRVGRHAAALPGSGDRRTPPQRASAGNGRSCSSTAIPSRSTTGS